MQNKTQQNSKIDTHTHHEKFAPENWREEKENPDKYQAAIISIRTCAEIQGGWVSRAKNDSFSTLQCPKPPHSKSKYILGD